MSQPLRTAPRSDRGVVFLLDGDRAGPVTADEHGPPPRRFDNRYSYRICRFPPPRLLQQDGLTAAFWLSPPGIAPDLIEYAQTLAEAGLAPKELPFPMAAEAAACAP